MGSQQVLQGIGNDIVNELARSLGTHFKGGDLLNSISYSVEGGQIKIYMLPYWKYVEYGCFFDQNTKIIIKGGEKKLKDLTFNDEVWTGKEYKKIAQKEKIEVNYPIRKVIIKTENNVLEVTEDHPILTKRGWLSATQVRDGDIIYEE